MLIIRVELENIKSYRSAAIELRRGTTAIRGQNGAGKTTLVEAIGFALFDYLPYSQAQFVREGERGGQVTVTFQSGLDGEEYAVVRRCGTPSAWYVYDPRIDKRLVEQKADVVDWLREHLPLQGDIELGAFFSDALGVQQGTFTSDFLAAPGLRKRKFDALLQIEDYRKAFDKLLETRNHLQDSAKEAHLRVQALENETAHVAVWREEVAARHAEYEAGSVQHLKILAEHTLAKKLCDSLVLLSEEVRRLADVLAQAKRDWQSAQEVLAQAEHHLADAKAAQQKVEESAADYRCYVQVEVDLREAHQQQQARQTLLERQATQERERAKASVKEEQAQEQLEQALAARQRMTALAPLVEQQALLEEQVSTAQQHSKRLRDVERELEQLEVNCARWREELAEQARSIAMIEALRPEAAPLAERREEAERLNLAVQRRGDWERELKEVRDSLRAMEEQCRQADAALAKRQADVDKLLANRSVVATLPALETEWNELRQQVILLTGNIKRHNESKLQSAGGHCPFLREPCLNIREKGLLSLETYFDGLIARDQAALGPLEAKQADLEQQVQDLRTKKIYVDRLDEYEQSLREAQDRQDYLRQETKRLASRERELVASIGAASKSAQRLIEVQALLKQSDEADKQVRTLDGLFSQQKSLQRQLVEQIRKLEGLRAEQADLADAPAQELEAARQLSALGDPRREYAQQEFIAAQEQRLKETLNTESQAVARADEALAALQAQLAPYAGLDERITRLNQQVEQSRSGYEMYLAHEQMAGKAKGRQSAYDAALDAERQAHKRYALADQCHLEKARNYDPQALEKADQEERRLYDEVVQLGAHLGTLQEKIKEQESQIAAAQNKELELAAARAEHAELGETREMLQQFRETIRDAAPHVMKELLKQISKEANRIFGDILGDRSVTLSWEEEYEIVLRTRGQERSFAQLSGGEQMSAALAVRLALLKTLAKLDVAFFDEPTQNMDELRRGNLAEQIRRVRGFNQLIVISHDDTFEQSLDSVIYLHKRDGETVVGEGDLALAGSFAETGFDGVGR
jgi:DNA repair protein SbcC/Rad50